MHYWHGGRTLRGQDAGTERQQDFQRQIPRDGRGGDQHESTPLVPPPLIPTVDAEKDRLHTPAETLEIVTAK